MKTSNLISKARAAACAALLLTGFTNLNAQIFQPAVAAEYVYPPGSPNSQLPTCYSYANVGNILGGPVDVYLSAINGQMMWNYTKPGNPLAVLNQGVISYSGDMDLNVGFMIWGSIPTAVVAFYRPGVGHFYEVYKISSGGLSLLSSTQISTEPTYKRISIDSHKSYGIIIAWEESTGIFALTGLYGVYTAPVYINGSSGYERPDVAFSHSNVGLNLHFVYTTPNSLPGYDIIEAEVDFFVLNGTSGSISLSVMDTNPVTALWSKVTPSIDAPDHYMVDNWAYTYAVDGQDIYVRAMDFNTSSLLTTNIVDGSLGNAAIWSKEFRPRLAYNQNCNTFHVTWFSSFSAPPFGNCYLTEQISETGAVLVSSPDYLTVANNSNFPAGATLNSIAFSKQNDNSPYFYAVFLDQNGVHHAFHKWTNTGNFRTVANPADAIRDQCTAHQAQHGSTATGFDGKFTRNLNNPVSIGPNPFNGSFKIMVPASLKDEPMNITVTNLQGQVILQQETVGANLAAIGEKVSKQLAQGMYVIKIDAPKAGVQQTFKVNKTGDAN